MWRRMIPFFTSIALTACAAELADESVAESDEALIRPGGCTGPWCYAVPPRPLSPMSTSTPRSTHARLRFRRGVEGTTPVGSVEVQLCQVPGIASSCVSVGVELPDGAATGEYDPGPIGWSTAYWRVRGVRSGVASAWSPTWAFHPRHQGISVSSAASSGTVFDGNLDGYADSALGDPEHASSSGRVMLFEGGADGLEWSSEELLSTDGPGARYGDALASASDMNGDGYPELAVGAPGADGGTGRVRVLRRISSGGWTELAVLTPPVSGAQSFGSALARGADFNGDGYADLAVGAPFYGADHRGRVYVWYGRAGTSLRTLPGIPSPIAGESGVAGILAPAVPAANAEFGTSLDAAGDVDGDGYDDLLVGEGGPGRALLFRGGPNGLAAVPSVTITTPYAAGIYLYQGFGRAVAGIGDVNGDARYDFAIGAPQSGAAGRVAIYYGSSSLGAIATLSSASDVRVGVSSSFGRSLDGARDIDDDGLDDVVVGSSDRVTVYPGSAAGLGTPVTLMARTVDFGRAVRGAGDVDGDWASDLVLGAQGTLLWARGQYGAFGLTSPTPAIGGGGWGSSGRLFP